MIIFLVNTGNEFCLIFFSPLKLIIVLIFINSVSMVYQMIYDDRFQDIWVWKADSKILLILIILKTLHHHIVLFLLKYYRHFLDLLNPFFIIFEFITVFKISPLHVELNFFETYNLFISLKVFNLIFNWVMIRFFIINFLIFISI